MAGIAFYWGEGAKLGGFSVSNAEPRYLEIFKRWCEVYAPQLRLAYSLYIHEDVVIEEARTHWRQALGLTHDTHISLVHVVPRSRRHAPKRILPYGVMKISGRGLPTEQRQKMEAWSTCLLETMRV
jgi:hypothetical protein